MHWISKYGWRSIPVKLGTASFTLGGGKTHYPVVRGYIYTTTSEPATRHGSGSSSTPCNKQREQLENPLAVLRNGKPERSEHCLGAMAGLRGFLQPATGLLFHRACHTYLVRYASQDATGTQVSLRNW